MNAKAFGLIAGALFCGVMLSFGVTEEVPIGRLRGSIVMKENGKPLPGAFVSLSLLGSDHEDLPEPRAAETAPDGTFSFRNLPAGAYELAVSASNHNLKRRIVSVAEGQTASVSLKAEPTAPYLNMYASQRVFTPSETPKVELHGFVPDKDVQLGVYRLDMEQLAKDGGYRQAISPLVEANAGGLAKLNKVGTKVISEPRLVVDRDAEGAFVDTLPIGNQKEGVYLVSCKAGDVRANTVVIVSQLALVTKTAHSEALCYATDIVSGMPVEGAEILTRHGDQLSVATKTNKDGLATVALKGEEAQQYVVMARHGASLAMVGGWAGQAPPQPTWMNLYCERPAYRPGDAISFKGFVRKTNVDGYRLPGDGTVHVVVNDPEGNKVTTMDLPVNAHGSFHGTFATSPEGKPGSYGIVCKGFGIDAASTYANVVAYRKPEFDITVESQHDHYMAGDRAAAIVSCKYYYGGPVVGAKVKATIYRSPAFSYDDENGEQVDGESYGGGEYSEDVEAVTDANGKATLEFETRAKNDPDVFTNDFIYTVSASVTEDGGKYFSGDGEVRVVRGDFGLQMEVQNPVLQPGDTADLLIKTTDPVDSTKPSPNRLVFVDAGREEWTGRTSAFLAQTRYRALTDADGVAHIFVPIVKSQSMAFRATASDAEGRKIIASSYAYVVGSPAEAERSKGELKVTLDKKHYAEGDSAKVLIQTDSPGGTALVCLQTNDILWKEVVQLTSGSTLVEVPIRREYAPNVYVSVACVRNKRFLEAEKRLRVERQDRTLKVEVKPDRDTYKPGETAMVTVRTTDVSGKPVAAEMSLGVVDEGIYDIAEDDTNLYSSLYPERGSEVRTEYSFPEIYLDGGDKGSSSIPIRTNFKDTAAWVPTIWTGPTGEAKVPVVLPDNLTQWRFTAMGLSDTSMAGKATATARVKKDLMVRLQLPQYLVAGDHQRMTVVVANDTGSDQDVHVQLQASGISLTGESERVLRVPNGSPQVVEMEADAGAPGNASLTAKAWIRGGATDGVQQSFRVLPHGRVVLDTKAGEGTKEFAIAARSSMDPSFGELKITVSPTLAGDAVKALDGLIDFPYGCVEQTMSRFMPSILVGQTVKELGLPEPKRLANLPKIVADSLARLASMRHSDGGWGWWESDGTDPFITALVLDGLDRARSAGYDVSSARPEEAVKWATQYMKQPKLQISNRDRLYLTYGLLRWKAPQADQFLKGIDLRDKVEKQYGMTVRHPGSAELATAALVFHEAGQGDKATDALNRLRKRAVVGDETAYWASEDDCWGEEPTSLALVAFEAVQPEDPIVPRIVRHMMSARVGNMWSSTRDTAYALVGITTYLRRTKEMSSSSVATVIVNGVEQAKLNLDPHVLDDPARTIVLPRSKLGSGPVKIAIRKEGKGRCYFTVALTGLEVAQILKPVSTDNGLSIDRQYYRMEAQRLENGELRLLPSKKPITQFANGDVVRVQLTIRSDKTREFILVKEPTPSSCRVTERTGIEAFEDSGWWWSQTVLLDDHLAFFARSLPAGVSQITYNMRAEQPGTAHALPTTVSNMYDPGRWASGGEAAVEVTK